MEGNYLGRLGEIKLDLDGLTKPDGSRDYPASSCKSIHDCYPDKKDGMKFCYKIEI